MPEIVSTRANPMIDPALHVWGWEIPVYLFLGGWVAGMMVLTGYALFQGRYAKRSCVCSSLPLVSLVLLSLGMFALFLDLEHKLYVWRLYVAFEPRSPMSWGAWILLLVYPVLLASALVRPPEPLAFLWPGIRRLSERVTRRAHTVRGIGVASMALGVALGIYTGILLSALGARPLWSSALLGPLFLFSGLSTGAAFGHLVARDREEGTTLARADNAFLLMELLLIALILIGLTSATEAHARAADLLLGGPWSAAFWVGVVSFGILIPLFVQSLAVRHHIAHTPIAPVLVMLGGLALRIVIVYAGQASHWPRA
jgi:formate-dependent nitrite reductase membrane component NrfD